jgi:hypothetical protein
MNLCPANIGLLTAVSFLLFLYFYFLFKRMTTGRPREIPIYVFSSTQLEYFHGDG